MTFPALQRIPLFRALHNWTLHDRKRHIPLASGIDHRRAVSALEEAGFWVLREGVHIVMTNGTRILTIPCQDPVYALTLEGIVRDSGLSVENFRQLL